MLNSHIHPIGHIGDLMMHLPINWHPLAIDVVATKAGTQISLQHTIMVN